VHGRHGLCRAAVAVGQVQRGLPPRPRVGRTKDGIARYIGFCNTARPHSSLDNKTSQELCFAALPAIGRAA
jgi:hypothetical protein